MVCRKQREREREREREKARDGQRWTERGRAGDKMDPSQSMSSVTCFLQLAPHSPPLLNKAVPNVMNPSRDGSTD
jgi:hypothetical protein